MYNYVYNVIIVLTKEPTAEQWTCHSIIHVINIIKEPIAEQWTCHNIYRRPGFNCVVKQLRFWLFKVDCEFKDCDLRVLRIGHTCVIYTLRSNDCELREKSQFAIFKLRN